MNRLMLDYNHGPVSKAIFGEEIFDKLFMCKLNKIFAKRNQKYW